jgi:PUA domain protein
MVVKIKNRHRLKGKEIQNITQAMKKRFNSEFLNKKSSVEIGVLDGFSVLLIDGEVDFIMINDIIFFSLKGLDKYKPNKYYVIVDMGAVGFVIKGADIMNPGIVDADEQIQKNDLVWIGDERHRKPIAIGIALVSGENMGGKQTGKAIKNIHYIGDNLWKLYNS